MQFIYFRPGEQKRMIARCQFGMFLGDTKAGATLTYPIKNYSWRHAICKHYTFHIDLATQSQMFDEVLNLFVHHSDNVCNDDCYSDFSEQANAIPRLVSDNSVCHSFLILKDDVISSSNYTPVILTENSELLLNSLCYKTIHHLIKDYERIAEQFPKPQIKKLP